MKSQTNKLWPRVLSLVLSLSLVAGLMPAALASSPHQHTSQCPKELSCEYSSFLGEGQILVCGKEEQAPVEAHHHTAECYQDNELTCGKEETDGTEGHSHTADCYHTHTESCYTYTCTPVTGVTVAPGSMSLSPAGPLRLRRSLHPRALRFKG